jgi:hypothetical protein
MPIFEIENVYIGPSAIAECLSGVDGVKNVQCREIFSRPNDVPVSFDFMGLPFAVWQPFGDNSRYWIGPADMIADHKDVPDIQNPKDLDRLEEAFTRYTPPFWRKITGDIITLRFVTQFLK